MAKLEFNHRTLPQGYQLGDYVIEDLLGQGGFGIAYLAKDLHLHNHVVIKEYFPNEIVSRDGQTVAPFGTSGQDDFERGMQRFVEEGRALARFNHPAVVRILKYFQQNNTAYLVMEFIDGEPLDQYLKRKGTLTPEVVEHLASELLDGLTVVHQHGLIHRDIKPANIMLRPGGKPVLIDFGAAKDALAEKSHSVVVTAGYGALEQYSSKSQLTPASDLYALGGTLYKCLTGDAPEEATSRVIDDEHTLLCELSIAKDCSPELVALIDQCMEIRQTERPRDAKEAKGILTQKQTMARSALQDLSPLIVMIDMAGRNGKILQEELNYITEKAQHFGIDRQTIQATIEKTVRTKNWIIESVERPQSSQINSPINPINNQVDSPPVIDGRYLDHHDGTATDIQTGLMWQRISVGQSWNGQTPIGNAKEYGWETACELGKKNVFFSSGADKHWKYAITYAGHNDWRLPTIDELRTLVCRSSGRKHPRLSVEAFPRTPSDFYWSATSNANNSKFAWGVHFADGVASSGYSCHLEKYVRLVRSGQ